MSRPREIPTIADYAHHNELAAQVWWEENRYDMEHPAEPDYDEDDWGRHHVFVTDDGIVPRCDICDGPQRVEGDNWNGETGNHISCEENE